MTNKIILSTVTTLVLLLTGCTDEQKQAITDAKAQIADSKNQSSASNTNVQSADNTDNITDSSTENISGTNPADPVIHNPNTGGNDTGSDAGSGNNGDDTSNGGGNNDGGNPGGGNSGDGNIPGPGNGADIPVTSKNAGGWFGRTQVSATDTNTGKVYSHSTAGVFGELIDSTEVKDKHDIAGYGPAILQVVFPQTEWNEEDNGDYFSNYQNFDEDSKKSWTFQIKNQHTVNLSNAAISINLDGVHNVNYKKIKGKIIYDENSTVDVKKRNALTLVDVDNNSTYTIDELQTANLNMQGLHTRTFRWVLGTVESSDYEAIAITTDDKATITAFSTANKSNDASIGISAFSAKQGGKFGLPPQ